MNNFNRRWKEQEENIYFQKIESISRRRMRVRDKAFNLIKTIETKSDIIERPPTPPLIIPLFPIIINRLTLHYHLLSLLYMSNTEHESERVSEKETQ